MKQEVEWLHIDKLYNITDDVMDSERWKVLGNVYEQLPAFQGVHGQIPYWFGTTDKYGLYASVEPPGLQVAGIVNADEWKMWESEFLRLATAGLGFSVVCVFG